MNLFNFLRDYLSYPRLLLNIEAERLRLELLSNPKYSDLGRLEKYGFKVYSQNDEDGILQEIFHRIGTTNKRFVEFGVGNGLENNTAYLLMQGWTGLWIEASNKNIKNIKNVYADLIKSKQLIMKKSFIDKDNINAIIGKNMQGEIDLLSIDIDGNDYYVLENINVVSPRVLVVEYNAKFHPPVKYVMKYNKKHLWDGTDKQGMSLVSITELCSELGYQLVGTNLTGVNAFFVRKEIIQNSCVDLFTLNSTPEYHYNEPLYFLYKNISRGHKAKHCNILY